MALNARLPEDLERLLSDHCRRHGLTRTAVVSAALRRYLRGRLSRRLVSGYDLAEDLIPSGGAAAIQSENVKALARVAFRRRSA